MFHARFLSLSQASSLFKTEFFGLLAFLWLVGEDYKIVDLLKPLIMNRVLQQLMEDDSSRNLKIYKPIKTNRLKLAFAILCQRFLPDKSSIISC